MVYLRVPSLIKSRESVSGILAQRGGWAVKQETPLPGEGPSALGRCHCDTLSPKYCSNVGVTNRGSADEAVVIVKFDADDFMVT